MKKDFKQVEKNTFVSCDGLIFNSQYIDEHGNAIERTPGTHPYSYDGFITHRLGENEDVNNTIYSDRLLQWDYKKYNELSKKHFGNEGQYFYDRSPEMVEAFLRDWCEDPELKLIFIMEYCNVSNGYPTWRFDFKQTKKI